MSQAGPPDAAPIMALSTAFWGAQVLLTANRLGIFIALNGAPQSAAELAASLSLAPRHTELLLNACAGLGLLDETDGQFANSAAAGAYLVPGRPGYLGNAIRYSDNLYQTWGELEACVRVGEPQMATATYTGAEREITRDFVYGMHDRAMGIGRVLAEMVELGAARKLLDVGGGPATYACLFAQRFTELECCVLDLPGIVAHAADIIDDFGLGARVSTLPGDFHETPFPSSNDAVLISGVVHRELESGCRMLLDKARDALVPGGMLIVSDVFAASGARDTFADLFGVNMMLTAEHGGVHDIETFASWMREAGFDVQPAQAFPPPMPHKVITGSV